MGYSEQRCDICGVSFNISRFRTEGEPTEAAWRNTGDGVREFVDDFEEIWRVRCVSRGCCFIRRTVLDDFLLSGDDENERWPPPTSVYASSDFDPEAYPGSEPSLPEACPTNDESGKLEHIAGPNCTETSAHSGARISVESMRGCNTYQCLVPKAPWWAPASDDEPFEVDGTCFLSGLGDVMNSTDMDTHGVFPARHRCEQPLGYQEWDWSTGHRPINFHPTCLEMFKRASLHSLGKVDIQGFADWFRLDRTYDHYLHQNDLPVRRARDQWWLHHPGDEYLVANPCFVPELEVILSDARTSTLVGNDVAHTKTKAFDSAYDVFSRFPYDVKHEIALHLSFTDLSSLEKVSPSFRQLPPTLYYNMVVRGLPWFYEAWCPLPYSRWATTTQKHLLTGARAEALMVPELDRDGTDWRALGEKLEEVVQGEALGLRNRRRIWGHCQEILNRMALRDK